MNWIFNFPFKLNIDVALIDRTVKNFSVQFSGFFNIIKNILNGLIGGILTILNFIPWWVLVLFVFLAGWKLTGKLRNGILYSCMLFFIGIIGLWDLMNDTLSIVLAAVFISLLLGFPIGILISGNDKINGFVRPILDTMQTMPVFVYLIPAVLFFGLGKAPAVIATTIYAIVPVIRLTSHGIRLHGHLVLQNFKHSGKYKYLKLFQLL
jgi:glycine betaine/proline transport system permease protein